MIICQCHDESFPWHSGNQIHQGEDEVNKDALGEDEVNNDAFGEDESEGRVAVPNRMNFRRKSSKGGGGHQFLYHLSIFN